MEVLLTLRDGSAGVTPTMGEESRSEPTLLEYDRRLTARQPQVLLGEIARTKGSPALCVVLKRELLPRRRYAPQRHTRSPARRLGQKAFDANSNVPAAVVLLSPGNEMVTTGTQISTMDW